MSPRRKTLLASLVAILWLGAMLAAFWWFQARYIRPFEARTEHIKPLVDEKRWRIWRIYLAGCAWAFAHDEVAIYQVLCRPSGQLADGLPWSRRWMYEQAPAP